MDPELGRFVSADPTIQHPYDPQDFNRYAYARNNPVKYIDPTGYGWLKSFFRAFVGGFIGALLTAMNIPAPIAFAISGALTGAIFGAIDGGLNGALRGALFGGISGAAFGFIGLNPGFAGLAMAAGATYAGITGGVEGLANFAAGMAGGATGSYTGNSFAQGLKYSNSPPPPPKTKGQADADNKDASGDFGGGGDKSRKDGGDLNKQEYAKRSSQRHSTPHFKQKAYRIEGWSASGGIPVKGPGGKALAGTYGEYKITDMVSGESANYREIGGGIGLGASFKKIDQSFLSSIQDVGGFSSSSTSTGLTVAVFKLETSTNMNLPSSVSNVFTGANGIAVGVEINAITHSRFELVE